MENNNFMNHNGSFDLYTKEAIRFQNSFMLMEKKAEIEVSKNKELLAYKELFKVMGTEHRFSRDGTGKLIFSVNIDDRFARERSFCNILKLDSFRYIPKPDSVESILCLEITLPKTNTLILLRVDEQLTGKKLIKVLQARGVVFGISDRKLKEISGALLAFLIHDAEVFLIPPEKGFYIHDEEVRFAEKEELTWAYLARITI